MRDIKTVLHTLPQIGKLTFIGLRPQRRSDIVSVTEVTALKGQGLLGDHRAEKPKNANKRQVTLIQHEHLDVVASVLHVQKIDPKLTRRNLLISGINLLALKDRDFFIGNVLLSGTGPCHPCTRMEENLGTGGLNAMRGHGGITASVLTSGTIHVGDEVKITNKPDIST